MLCPGLLVLPVAVRRCLEVGAVRRSARLARPRFDPRLSSRNLVSAALRRPRRVLIFNAFINGFPKVFPRGGGTAVEQTSTAGPAHGARRRGHVNETTNSTLKELSPTRNKLPEKTHEENSIKLKTPIYPRRLDEGCLVWKKRKEKSADSGSPESQLRRRRIRFGNWMIPLNMFNGGSQTVKTQILDLHVGSSPGG